MGPFGVGGNSQLAGLIGDGHVHMQKQPAHRRDDELDKRAAIKDSTGFLHKN
jgi:hypothetical protein